MTATNYCYQVSELPGLFFVDATGHGEIDCQLLGSWPYEVIPRVSAVICRDLPGMPFFPQEAAGQV